MPANNSLERTQPQRGFKYDVAVLRRSARGRYPAKRKGFSTMTDQAQAPLPAITSPVWLVRVAGWCAYLSGIVAIFGIVFLVAFFTVGGGFGKLNDIAAIVQLALMLPIAVTLQQLLRPHGPALSMVAMLLGIAGMLAVIALQILLVVGVLTFKQQIGMVGVGYLLILGWFVINAYLGRSTEWLPHSMLLTLLAGLYIGYPVWGYSLGRRLLSWKHKLQTMAG